MDEPAILLKRGQPRLPDSLMAGLGSLDLVLPVLVDERGRAVVNALPWLPLTQLPPLVASAVVGSLNDWHFKPAIRGGAPHAVWATVHYTYQPPGAKNATSGAKH
jgi:hypothetical protein